MKRWAGRIGTAPTCAAGRPPRPRPRCGRPGRRRCWTADRCSCPTSGDADPVLAGALRVAEALEGGATSLIGVWQRAPLQAIARLHALAAADLADDERLGRPRGDADVGRRLELLADIVTGGTRVPAPVLAAVVARRAADAGAVRHRRRCGGAGGVAAGDHRQRPGPARPRRAGGVLDAPVRRLPRRGSGLRVGHARRPRGVAGAQLPRALHAGAREALSIAQAASS